MKEDHIKSRRTCLYCGDSIENKRMDAKFCNAKCKDSYGHAERQKQKQEKAKATFEQTQYMNTQQEIAQRDSAIIEKIVAKPIKAIQLEIEKLEQERDGIISQLGDGGALDVNPNHQLYQLKFKKEHLENEIDRLNIWMNASDEKVYNYYMNPHRSALEIAILPTFSSYYKRFTPSFFNNPKNRNLLLQITKKRNDFKMRYQKVVQEFYMISNEVKCLEDHGVRLELNRGIQQARVIAVNKKIAQLQNALIESANLDRLKTVFEEVTETNKVEIKPIEILKTNLPKVSRQEMSVHDILNLKSETFLMKGELGEFFGQLERQSCAIALIGDSGAGKSYFSYDIAELFDKNGFSVYYFSLEEGLGELTKKKLRDKSFSNKLVLSADGKLPEVRKAAKDFDVIIIDSFGKIEAKPDDYDKLRRDFPRTIFICIFQKTTQGSVRGGSQIVFDSSAIIDVQKRDEQRIAVMQKSRYGTADWEYSITEKQMIKR